MKGIGIYDISFWTNSEQPHTASVQSRERVRMTPFFLCPKKMFSHSNTKKTTIRVLYCVPLP